MTQQAAKPSPDANHADSGPGSPVANRSTVAAVGSVITVVVVLAALAVGAYALFRTDSLGNATSAAPERFQLDLAAQMEVPAELLAYVEQRRLDVSLHDPKAIAVAANGHVYVVGNSSIEVLRSDGSSTVTALEGQPTCLAVAGRKDANVLNVYVGVGRHIVVLNDAGELVRQWSDADAKSVFTGIAVAGESVFVADAGQRLVLHYSADGKLIGTIGKPDPDRQMPGFVIPSPYFDLVIDQNDMLHVVNPGMRRVEAYDFDGALQSYWGRAGSALPDFFGCCNPAHLAIMPDGRFVTSEKGIPRVKVYSPGGDLQQVVAGPRQLGVNAAALGDARGNQKERVFDVAVDGAGNVLVLDPHARQVIVFGVTDHGLSP